MNDPIHNPRHYTSHPSGIECIQITEHMGFCLGNAVKYIWRADLKHDAVEDLQKAKWYIERELQKRTAVEIEPAPDWLLKTAQNLARHMSKNFYPEVPEFEVLDDLAGVISQIDNMVTGLQRKPVGGPPSDGDVNWLINHLRAIGMSQAADTIDSLAKSNG